MIDAFAGRRAASGQANQCIAVINAGSSSIKFALYDVQHSQQLRFRGQIERIGISPRLHVSNTRNNPILEHSWPVEGFDHLAATHEIIEVMNKLADGAALAGVGHRVVHGGTKYAAPIRIDHEVMSELEGLTPLAPLHQPHSLAPIAAILDAAPNLPQVACFDTAFHRSQPEVAQYFAIPQALTKSGIRRYGFHGLSYEYVASQLREIAPELDDARIVIAHLGNGASMCALRHGRSVATTMGFTALDGLMMGTRCGAIDPGVLIYLMDSRHMDARAIEDLLYRRSGLLGMSGISSDMRTLRTSSDPSAAEAISLFVYRIVREIGSLAAALGGLDALVFTGGIGENDAQTRAAVAQGCHWLGAELDDERNVQGAGHISTGSSRVAVWVVPTDEERMVFRHTVGLLQMGANRSNARQ